MNRFVDGNKLNLYLIAVLEQFLYAHPEANEWEKLQFSKKAEAYFYKREEEEQDRRVLKLLRGAFGESGFFVTDAGVINIYTRKTEK